MAKNYTNALETQLAVEILSLFHREGLTAPQAKSLLDKVRVLVDAGELGFFQQGH